MRHSAFQMGKASVSKLLCPKCMKSIALPDDFSGREVTCPSCHNMFEAPTRFNPTVLTEPVVHSPPAVSSSATTPSAPPGSSLPSTPLIPPTTPTPSETYLMSPEYPADHPPAPPGLVPTSSSIPHGLPSTEPAPLPVGYSKSHGFVISPRVVTWLPAILLTIAFICTFFPWVGTYLGGSPVDTQGPWRAIFGAVNRNYKAEKAMQTPAGWLEKVQSNWELMLPGLMSLIAAVVLAWADHGLRNFDLLRIPPLARIWPWRHGVIAALACIAFSFMMIQVTHGFGLERAAQKVVAEKFAKDREAAGGSTWDLDEVKYYEEQELAKFNLEHTTWLSLALTCNFLAVLAMLCRVGLDKRGSKPPPRIVIQY